MVMLIIIHVVMEEITALPIPIDVLQIQMMGIQDQELVPKPHVQRKITNAQTGHRAVGVPIMALTIPDE